MATFNYLLVFTCQGLRPEHPLLVFTGLLEAARPDCLCL